MRQGVAGIDRPSEGVQEGMREEKVRPRPDPWSPRQKAPTEGVLLITKTRAKYKSQMA